MRCFFTVDGVDGDAVVRVDTRMVPSSRDSAKACLYGTAFNDWLTMVVGRGMMGTDDGGGPIAKSPTAKRIKFTYRPPRDWEMEVPDEVVLGKVSGRWSSLFISLVRMFLTSPVVKPGRMCVKFLRAKGFDTVEDAVKGLLPTPISTPAGAGDTSENPPEPQRNTQDAVEHQLQPVDRPD